jgi:hypothetical protein
MKYVVGPFVMQYFFYVIPYIHGDCIGSSHNFPPPSNTTTSAPCISPIGGTITLADVQCKLWNFEGLQINSDSETLQ